MTPTALYARRPRPQLLSVVVAVIVSLLTATSATAAGPADLDTTFDGDGKTSAAFDGGLGFGTQDIAVQPDGKIVQVGVAGKTVTDPRTYAVISSDHRFGVMRFHSSGGLDASFGTGGKVMTDFYPPLTGDERTDSDGARAVAIQTDGKIVVAGTTGAVLGSTDDPDRQIIGKIAVARYNADGGLDQTFGDQGTLVTKFGREETTVEGLDVAIQADGKIVVVGRVSDFGVYPVGSGQTNEDYAAIVRYHANGSLDTSFDGDGIVTSRFAVGPSPDAWGNDVAIDAEGRIHVGGTMSSFDGENATFWAGVARYNPNGALDPTFDSDGWRVAFDGLGLVRTHMALQPDGKVVLVGQRYGRDSTDPTGYRWAVARINRNGSLDSSFSGDGLAELREQAEYFAAGDVTVQPNGKIVIVGTLKPIGAPSSQRVIRYNSDGSLDQGFGSGGMIATTSAAGASVLVQRDGKILAGGVPNLIRYMGGEPLDTVAPVVTLTDPSAGATVSGYHVLKATATDNVGVGEVEFRVDNKVVGRDSTPDANGFYSFIWDSRTVANGQHRVSVYAYDTHDSGYDDAVITVNNGIADTTPPTGTVTIENGATSTSSTSVALQLTATDAGSGVASMSFSSDGSTWSDWEAFAAGRQYLLPGGDGTKTVHARFRDVAGNISSEPAFDDIALQAPTSDPGTRTPRILTPQNGLTVGGKVLLSAMVVDSSGGEDHSGVDRVNFLLQDMSEYNTPYILSRGTNSYPYSVEWDTTAVPSGHRIRIYPYATTANTNTGGQPIEVEVDNVRPTGSVTINDGAVYTRSRDVILSAPTADVGSNVVQMRFRNDALGWSTWTTNFDIVRWTLSAANGTRTVYAEYMDRAGNISATASDTIVFDDTPPAVTMSAPSAGAYVSGNVTLSATATDNVRVASVQFLVNGAAVATDTTAPYAATWNATGLSGTHTVAARAVDVAGNAVTSSARAVTIDSTPPTATLTAPAAAAFLRGNVTLSAAATDNVGVASVGFLINGVAVATDTAAPYSVGWNTAGINGSRSLVARVTDRAGNVRDSSARTVTVDNTAPAAPAAPPAHAFVTPAEVDMTATPIAVRLTWPAVSDTTGSGLARHELERSVNGSTTWARVAPNLRLAPGTGYRFRVRAVDRAGNASAWKTGVLFRVAAYQEAATAADPTGSRIVYAGSWAPHTLAGSYYGNGVRYATASTARATFTFKGTSVAWVTTKGPDRGNVTVWLDGVQIDANPTTTARDPFSLHSSAPAYRQVVFARGGLSASTVHTLEVRVAGTSGRPRVDVDAFLVTR